MDFATTTVLVKRETKTATFSVDAMRALALTAAKNGADPSGSATFVDQAATVNGDGSIAVSLSIETVQPDPAPAAPAAQPGVSTTAVPPVAPLNL